ncbi:MAG: radical SAM protein [Nanoarchaeota archaeon]|nr:radical SAM protein [Nanoarchaeota archaeon]
MYEMRLQNIALFVGTGKCNANCAHCAGSIHRENMPKEDRVINEELFYNTLKYAYERGARSLSLTSGGEPTLAPNSVTKTLDIAKNFDFRKIKLYTNGIRIGRSIEFSGTYLPLWQSKGLTDVYWTVHSISEEKNAQVFGIKSYPSLELIVSRIYKAHLKVRANIVLSRGNISDLERFKEIVNSLKGYGVDNIAGWPVRDEKDEYDILNAPSMSEIQEMREWAKNDRTIQVQTEEHHELYKNKKKLGLFPDGSLSNSWCNH